MLEVKAIQAAIDHLKGHPSCAPRVAHLEECLRLFEEGGAVCPGLLPVKSSGQKGSRL